MLSLGSCPFLANHWLEVTWEGARVASQAWFREGRGLLMQIQAVGEGRHHPPSTTELHPKHLLLRAGVAQVATVLRGLVEASSILLAVLNSLAFQAPFAASGCRRLPCRRHSPRQPQYTRSIGYGMHREPELRPKLCAVVLGPRSSENAFCHNEHVDLILLTHMRDFHEGL